MKNWREVRKEAVERGLVDEVKVAEHRARALAELQAQREDQEVIPLTHHDD